MTDGADYNPDDDRRKFPRQATDLHITFAVDNSNRRCDAKEHEGNVRDISNAGMQFTTTHKLWSGAGLLFTISKKNGQPVCSGEAVVVLDTANKDEHTAHAKFLKIEMKGAA